MNLLKLHYIIMIHRLVSLPTGIRTEKGAEQTLRHSLRPSRIEVAHSGTHSHFAIKYRLVESCPHPLQ
jgi:hypothetical protein